jgi:hypothetical protein
MTATRIFSLAVGLKNNNASIYDYVEVELEVRAMISVMQIVSVATFCKFTRGKDLNFFCLFTLSYH